MYKVIALFDGEVREAIFATIMGAEKFAFALMTSDISTCPQIVEI